jgi:hypothetical protein
MFRRNAAGFDEARYGFDERLQLGAKGRPRLRGTAQWQRVVSLHRLHIPTGIDDALADRPEGRNLATFLVFCA